MKNKILAIVLCLTMVLTSGSFAFAADEQTVPTVEPTTETIAAEEVATDEELVEESVVEADVDESVIGKTGALKKGTVVYAKTDENSSSHPIKWSEEYLATIVDVTEVNGVVWYKYTVDNFAVNLVLKYFPYVKASEFVIGSVPNEDEPVTPEEPQDGIAGMTGEEILEAWDDYTIEEKKEALAYLQSEEGAAKYAEFNAVRFPELDDTEVRNYVGNFVDGMELFPEVETVASFEEAGAEILEFYQNNDLDIRVPDETLNAYNEAYNALAGAIESEAVIDYPAEELNAEVSEAFVTVAYNYYDAYDANAEDLDAVLEDNEYFSEALAKMYALEEVKPDIYGNNVALLNLNGSTKNLSYVDTMDNDNIEIHVFNYGTAINDDSLKSIEGQGFLPFLQSNSYDYDGDGGEDDAIDGVPNVSGAFPTMKKSLVDGYPYVDPEFSGNLIKAGSLKYLFDKTSGFIPGAGNIDSYSQLKSKYEGTTYQSMHFAANPGDTKLFVKKNGYYYYNSAENAAWFKPNNVNDSNGGRFYVYNTTVVPAYNTKLNSSHQGNFLPFNELTSENISLVSSWTYPDTDDLPEAEVMLKHEKRESISDMWFGMTAEFDFFMPKDGKLNDKNMEFEFIGDDDVWVYIDDVLILDIGGTHGAYTGTINFATGEVKYNNSVNTSTPVTTTILECYEDAYDELVEEGKENSDVAKKILNIIQNGFNENGTFKDYSKHSFNFFYMERGGNISTCKLQFNMEPLPKGSIDVTKQVEGLNEALAENTSYKFQLLEKTGNKPVANEEFDLIKGETTTSKATDANGYFSLKDEETAHFELVSDNTSTSTGKEYIVKEVSTGEFTVTHESDKCNGGNDVEHNFTIQPNEHQDVTFTNTWETKDLTIKKELDGYKFDDEKFDFDVVLSTATDENTTDNNIVCEFEDKAYDVQLAPNGEGWTVEKIPVNANYSIKEIEPSNSGTGIAQIVYEKPEYKVNGNATVKAFGTAFESVLSDNTEVVVENERYVNLTIQKTGTYSYDANQSYIFNVKGEDEYTEDINLDVAINEDGTATVTRLPLGKYTVSENEDWSWRYDATEIFKMNADQKDVLAQEETVELNILGHINPLTFNNTRTYQYWLDGNAYCENTFAEFSQGGTN